MLSRCRKWNLRSNRRVFSRQVQIFPVRFVHTNINYEIFDKATASGNWDAAERDLAKLLESQRSDPPIHYIRKFLQHFSKVGNIEKSVHYFTLMSRNGVNDPNICETLFRSYLNTNDVSVNYNECFTLWDQLLEDKNFTPSYSLFQLILNIGCKAQNEKKVKEIMDLNTEKLKYTISQKDVNKLMRFLSKAKKFNSCIDLFNSTGRNIKYLDDILLSADTTDNCIKCIQLLDYLDENLDTIKRTGVHSVLNTLVSSEDEKVREKGKDLVLILRKKGFKFSTGTNNIILRSYLVEGKVDESHRTFDNIHVKNSETYYNLIAYSIAEGLHESSISRYKEMIQKNIIPTVSLYKIMFNGFEGTQYEELFFQIALKGAVSQADENGHIFVFMDYLVEFNIQKFEQFLGKICEFSEFTPIVREQFTILVKHRNVSREAIDIFCKYILPDTISFNTILERETSLKNKMEYLRYMELYNLCNIQSYNIVLAAFLHSQVKIDRLSPILEAMEKSGFQLNDYSESLLLELNLRVGFLDRAKEMIRRILERDDASNYILSGVFNFVVKDRQFYIDLYNLIKDTDIYKKNENKFKKLFREVDILEPESKVKALMKELSVLLKSKNYPKAKEIFETFNLENLDTFDTDDYNIILEMYAKLGMYEEIQIWFNRMIGEKQALPNSKTLSLLFLVHVKDSEIDIEKLLELSDSFNIVQDTHFYNTLLNCLILNRKKEAALTLMDDMISNDRVNTRSFTMILSACPVKDIRKYEKLMMDRNIEPSLNTYTALLSRSPSRRKINEIEHNIKHSGMVMDFYSYTKLINAHLQRNSEKKMLKTYNEMIESGFVPNSILLMRITEYYLKFKRVPEAIEFFEKEKIRFPIPASKVSESFETNLLLEKHKMDKKNPTP
eukprot:TRINITY_DN1926_c0_g1_i1.p1 TRINITY_DN1926_c0_g1~~TRINITY_DN1926_c0_g1_i1.p1  ORF type:complete len:896 (+),score=142.25 TRINITY_DN1926_c0_g1_i1:50-2737(+)